MGCCSGIPKTNDNNKEGCPVIVIPPKKNDEDLEIRMEKLKRDLLLQIEENKFKIKSTEKEILEIENKIKQGEIDIQKNHFQYNESELKYKAKKLLELKRDKARSEITVESLSTYNETNKNNLQTIKNKIEEIKNIKLLKQGNEIMNLISKEDYNKILETNTKNLLAQKRIDDQNQEILQRANNQYVGDDILQNEEAYLKQLLGTSSPS